MQRIRHQLWTLLLLLAFVGQGLVVNGVIAVAKAEPINTMTAMHHQMNTAKECPESAMTDCCDGQKAINSVLPDMPAHHCCDGKGSCCKGQCHCAVASMTGSLVSMLTWSNHRLPEAAVATPEPHFTSIAVNPAFKPPIA